MLDYCSTLHRDGQNSNLETKDTFYDKAKPLREHYNDKSNDRILDGFETSLILFRISPREHHLHAAIEYHPGQKRIDNKEQSADYILENLEKARRSIWAGRRGAVEKIGKW